jgi:hypothetical protein
MSAKAAGDEPLRPGIVRRHKHGMSGAEFDPTWFFLRRAPPVSTMPKQWVGRPIVALAFCHWGNGFSLKFGFRNARNAHQLLGADFSADRNYQPPAHLELLLQRFWNFGTASSDHNRIIGRMLWPTLGAVGM